MPIRFYGTPCSVGKHPPMQGEHTREVLASLGYSTAEVDEQIAAGVTADRPEMLRRRKEKQARKQGSGRTSEASK